jgi:hypothetical protein
MSPVRYRYHDGLRLPAPFVNVTLRNLTGTSELADQPAQVDTGADRTVLPLKMVEILGLLTVDEIAVAGLGDARHVVRTFAVNLTVHDFPPIVVEVMGQAEEPWILLGRDVLNAYRLLLDGPQLALEIDRPPAK